MKTLADLRFTYEGEALLPSQSAFHWNMKDGDIIDVHIVQEGGTFLIASKGSNISENSVQAFAKLTGEDWTFYVQDLTVIIGRASDSKTPEQEEDKVDLDLGKSKTISRRHAKIFFDFNTRGWKLIVTGRNGVKINNVYTKASEDSIPLESKY